MNFTNGRKGESSEVMSQDITFPWWTEDYSNNRNYTFTCWTFQGLFREKDSSSLILWTCQFRNSKPAEN